ncbi:MAG: GAF domain-containing protein [Oscillospiraceae bacterium]|nr:GAF domain-containing protein [Oscillospiraceae bacterium]
MIQRIWRNLEIKIMTLLLISTALLAVGIYSAKHNEYYTLTIENLKQDAMTVHRYAEEVIDERSFSLLNAPEDWTSDVYVTAHHKMDEIRRIANILYLYTAKRTEDGRYIYVIDGLSPENELFRRIGDPIEEEIIPLLQQCLEDEIVLGDEILDTEWGIVYVAYFPFHDSEGDVVGAIGMEFDCESLYNAIRRARIVTLFFSGTLLLIFAVLAFVTIKKVVGKAESAFNVMEKTVSEANARVMLMLDTSPLCAQIWDRSLNTIDCNEAAVRLYGFKDKQEYKTRFLTDSSPEYQPDGQRSDKKAVELVNKAFEEGFCIFRWMHRHPGDGTSIPAEVTLVRAIYGDEYVVVGYTRDLREHELMMQGIKQRDDMLRAVNQTAILLLNADVNAFEESLRQSIAKIAGAVGVDRVHIWRNHTVDGQLYCSQLYEWSAQNTTYYEDEELYQYSAVFPGWEAYLSRRGSINGPVSGMAPEARSLLELDGILSILAAPVFMEDQFWGFVSFDDCHRERSFTDEEEAILNAASLLIAGSFIRNEMILDIHQSSERLKRQDDLLKSVNQTATLLLSTEENEDIEGPIMISLGLVGRSIDVDRVQIWRHENIGGESRFDLLFRWLSDVGHKKIIFPMGPMPPYVNIAEWEEKFNRNEYIGGPLSSLNADEQAYFSKLDVKAVAIIPLFMDDKLWGLFSIDDCVDERDFTADELAILRSVSLMLASAINRHALIEKRTRDLALKTTTLTTLFDSIPDLIFTKDLDLRFTQCNRSLYEHFGLREADVIGKVHSEGFRMPEELTAHYYETDVKVINEGVSFITEEYMPRADGYTPLYETIKRPLMLDGEVIGLLGIARDITKIKEAEQKSVSSYEYTKRLNEALANITTSPTLTGGDLKPAADVVTQGACKALNVSQVAVWWYIDEEFVLRSISHYSADSGQHTVQSDYDLTDFPEYAKLLKTERLIVTNSSEEYESNAAGDRLSGVCAALNAPIRADGKLVGVVCVEQVSCWEFDGKREWAIEEQTFVSSLADLMALAISGYERRKAHDAAETANQTKSVFLANMSHEIRTPMNAILGVTEILMQNRVLPTEIEEGLERIHSSCDMLLGIINDILDFSKIEAGKMDIRNKPYKIASLINDTLHLNMMRMDSKPLEFNIQIDENLPAELVGDELRIKQVLNNLLSNAFKYTETGSITLSIDCEAHRRGVTLVLGVRDTGYGMTREQLDRMYEEYSRFNQEYNRTIEGAGLGLAITHRLLHLMDGVIDVESEPGKGSLFTVRIPQKTTGFETLGSELKEQLRQFRVNYMSQKKSYGKVVRDPMPYGHVLIVDDVETNLYVAVGLMKLYMLKIDTAMSGRETLDKIAEGKEYDIIFMDHMMPEMDGMEATKRLRDMGYEAPIVALTANAVAGQADIFLQNGFDGFIAKPIDVRHLNSVLNKYVRDKQPPEVIEAARQIQKEAKEAAVLPPQKDSMLTEFFIRDAHRTVERIEGLLDVGGVETDEGLRQFVVAVHGIKSSLGHIGEKALADMALRLEMAGREKDIGTLTASAPAFLEELRALLEKLEPKQGKGSDGDVAELYKLFTAVRDMCAEYDRKGVLDLLAEIKDRSDDTMEVVAYIKGCIIHSEFEEAENVAASYAVRLSVRDGARISGRKVDGLDIAKGLDRYEGDAETYLRILRAYVTNISSMLEVMSAVNEEKLAGYKITVHGIKGASYDIHADRIGQKAEVLEQAAAAGDLAFVREHNPEFLEAAWAFIGAIDEMLTAIEAENPKPVKAEPDKGLLAKLLIACKEYDMDGADEAIDEIGRYQYESDDGLAIWLRENVGMMNFSQIVERLSGLNVQEVSQ